MNIALLPGPAQQHPILQRFNSLTSPFEKLTLARLAKSRAQRILWLLEELKVDYELKTYTRKGVLAPPELKEIHPLGKSPLLTVEAEGASEPLVLAESANIVEYLVAHYGSRLVPKQYPDGKDGQIGGETEEWMRYRYYMHYAEGTLMPYLIIKLLLNSRLCLCFSNGCAEPNPDSCPKICPFLYQTSIQFYHRWSRKEYS